MGQVRHGSAATTFTGKAAINPKTLAISEKDMGGEQIKGYLSICGKEQSVRKDWYFSI